MVRNIAAEYTAGGAESFFRLPVHALKQAEADTRPDLDRLALVAALRQYHQDLGTLDSNIEAVLTRLSHPNSQVVVTGQQAGLLTGPAYSVHKGVGAALLAQQLDTEDKPVVAIYWVASQDHDAAEVASTTLLDFEERLHRLNLPIPEGVPVGRILWQPQWSQQVFELINSFSAPAEYKEAVLKRVHLALDKGGSYADVFARLIHGLLSAADLVVLDPLHPALARLMAPAIAQELQQPLVSSQKIEEAALQLQQQGFIPQLRRPSAATNLFIEEPDGQRRLLRFDGKKFYTDQQDYSQKSLLALLTENPSLITPAAGLRPIIQDTLLPTLAFVVGPGEIAYGAQLKEVYPLHSLKQPLLWPRLSVTWLEPNVSRMLKRLPASAAAVQKNPEEVLGLSLAKQRNISAVTQQRLSDLSQQLEAVATDIAELDPTLVGAANKTQSKTVARVAHLQQLAINALARAENDRTGQLSRLKLNLLPNGIPQEREMNFFTYLLKHGEIPLKQLLALSADWQGEIEIP